MYLTCSEISVRIPLLHSWLFIWNNAITLEKLTQGVQPNITTSFLKCFIITIRRHKRRRRQKDFATEASAKDIRSQKSIEGISYQSERWSRTLESLRTPETEQDHFFVPSISILVKRPYVIFSISTSRSPVMLRFKILMFLSL